MIISFISILFMTQWAWARPKLEYRYYRAGHGYNCTAYGVDRSGNTQRRSFFSFSRKRRVLRKKFRRYARGVSFQGASCSRNYKRQNFKARTLPDKRNRRSLFGSNSSWKWPWFRSAHRHYDGRGRVLNTKQRWKKRNKIRHSDKRQNFCGKFNPGCGNSARTPYRPKYRSDR